MAHGLVKGLFYLCMKGFKNIKKTAIVIIILLKIATCNRLLEQLQVSVRLLFNTGV